MIGNWISNLPSLRQLAIWRKPLKPSAVKRQEALSGGRTRWSAVSLIYLREMRDQLRDRRTLFTIIVLPMLLYPIVGMLLLQIAQFTRTHATTVCVIGVEHVTQSIPGLSAADGAAIPPLMLLDANGPTAPGSIPQAAEQDSGQASAYRFHDQWGGEASHIELDGYQSASLLGQAKPAAGSASPPNATPSADLVRSVAQQWVQEGRYHCVVCVSGPLGQSEAGKPIELVYNVASDQSTVARDRVAAVLNQWRGRWVRDRLAGAGVDLAVLDPFEIESVDIAPARTREAAFWSKLLPFIMLIWAMTGAFYPAIDLVAGEKERGTLETLLCSPALRTEIVWGKLGAVMSFSMMTALLNACSMLVTSSFVFHQMGIGPGGSAVGTPPLAPMLWLLVALIPLSALFSALALAVAAMARSSKEGQYYLMPLMMLTLPLVLLPMLPGTTLSLGTSLIPVTGMFLLVRTLVEGHLWEALVYVPIVAVVTGVCLSLAVRWARQQFESEAVLFGDGDQWELSAWVRHLWRDRELAATPSVAYGCGLIILVALFFGKLAVTELPRDFADLAKLVILPQLGLILAPMLLMATMMTTSLRTSLRLHLPDWRTWPLAVVLCLSLHPLYVQLSGWISAMYPLSDEAAAAMEPFAVQIATAPWLSVVFLMAAIPAVCEELTFRGFIFGGLIRGNSPLRAVLVTAVMFGVSHGVLQQSLSATVIGVLLGWVALRTGSVLPGILIHFGINTLSVSMQRLADLQWPVLQDLLLLEADGVSYHPLYSAASLLIATTALLLIHRITSTEASVTASDALADRVAIEPHVADPSIKRLATAATGASTLSGR